MREQEKESVIVSMRETVMQIGTSLITKERTNKIEQKNYQNDLKQNYKWWLCREDG